MPAKDAPEQLVRRRVRRSSSTASPDSTGPGSRASRAHRRWISTFAYYSSFAILLGFAYLFFTHVEPDLAGGGISGYKVALVLFLMAGVAFRADYPFNVNVVMLATLFFAGMLAGGYMVHGALRPNAPAR